MINIASLKVDPEVKKVRETINTPQGTIEIYEPSVEVANRIIEIERGLGMTLESTSVMFDERIVLKELFPLLTNINIGDHSDEELESIIANPSVHLLIAQNIIAQIISEVNKLYAERIKNEFANAQGVMAQIEIISSIPQILVETAKHDPHTRQLVEDVQTKMAEVEALLEQAEGEANEQNV